NGNSGGVQIRLFICPCVAGLTVRKTVAAVSELNIVPHWSIVSIEKFHSFLSGSAFSKRKVFSKKSGEMDSGVVSITLLPSKLLNKPASFNSAFASHTQVISISSSAVTDTFLILILRMGCTKSGLRHTTFD